MTLWEVDIYPGEGQPDLAAQSIAADAADLGLCEQLDIAAAQGYLLQGELGESEVQRLADELFSDAIVDSLIEKARMTFDEKERVEVQGAVTRRVHELQPYTFLFYPAREPINDHVPEYLRDSWKLFGDEQAAAEAAG